ncbi:GNAT family N-acetyltransferase [Mangrovimonas spongiae]|uniref:GNAT family N-acetyltransferase n=1 Tax=Mangrovimonas spongiae TaxID=2494697 RepID=UPI001F0C2E5C|nr:GNAT family N-acetyltransferase [Mangrovimonas spongiae]
MDNTYSIKIISAKDTYDVRHPVLRPGRPITDCVFEGDNLDTTYHLGLFHQEQLIGVVSLMRNSNKQIQERSQYQLRGMAILKPYQGQGLGKYLIDASIKKLTELHCEIVWCNAREIALSFYKRNQFQVLGEPFSIPLIGNHFTMFRKIN